MGTDTENSNKSDRGDGPGRRNGRDELERPEPAAAPPRYGFYYGPGTWFHPDGAYADKVRRQEFPIIGAGSGVWSWVHVEDAALATVEITWRGKTVYTSVWQEPVQLALTKRRSLANRLRGYLVMRD